MPAEHRRLEGLLLAAVWMVALATLLVRAIPGSPVVALDHRLIDSALRAQAAAPVDTSDVTVVLLDDDSLLELGERWPLRRRTWAAFVRAASAHQPAVIAVDAWFEVPEPTREVDLALDLADRLRLTGLADDGIGARLADDLDRTALDLDGDHQLARALAASGVTVLGLACVPDARGLPAAVEPPPSAEPVRMECPGLSGNLPALALAARGQAVLDLLHDRDGRVRRYPFRVGVGDATVPTLALQAVAVGRPDRYRGLAAGVAALDGAAPIQRPIDPAAFRTLRFSDVLRATPDDPVVAKALGDRLVFVGVSAQGTEDLVLGALGRGIPGAYLHATAAVDLLAQRHVITDGAPSLLGIGLGGLVLLVVAGLGLRWSTAPALVGLGLGAAATWGAGALVALDAGWAVPVVPVWGGLAGLTAVRSGFAWWRLDRSRRVIRDAFGRYVTPQLADRLLAEPDALQLGGTEQTVTIMMSDLRGFTSLTERLGPARTVDLLNRYLGAMTDVILAHAGTIDEFLGDGILVLFGAPFCRDDDAVRAVQCAVAMQQALQVFNEQRPGDQPVLEMGIGIATGRVIAGNIGSTRRIKYGVVGDPVNRAARVESLTVGTQVLLDRLTHDAAADRVDAVGPMEVQVKGKAEPLQVYELKGLRGGAAVPIASEHDWTDAELAVTVFPVLGKRVASEGFDGLVRRHTARRVDLEVECPIEPFANVMLAIRWSAETSSDELWGKVVRVTPGRLVVQVTAATEADHARLAAPGA